MAKRRLSGPTRSKPKDRRQRDYRAEYQRRVQRGIAKGLSRSQARGHARAGERTRVTNRPVNPKAREEEAIRMMKAGASLRRAAQGIGVSEQHLRRYIKENTGAVWNGKRWTFNDQRPRRFPIYSTEGLVSPLLAPVEASRAGLFMNAVRRFLPTGDVSILAPYVGQGVTDVDGRFHLFETDPNRLYELDAAGELSFPEFYRIIT